MWDFSNVVKENDQRRKYLSFLNESKRLKMHVDDEILSVMANELRVIELVNIVIGDEIDQTQLKHHSMKKNREMSTEYL